MIYLNSYSNSIREVQPSLLLLNEATLFNEGPTSRKWQSHDSNLGPYDLTVHLLTIMLSMRWHAGSLGPGLPTTPAFSLNAPLFVFYASTLWATSRSWTLTCFFMPLFLFLHTNPSSVMPSPLYLSRFNSSVNSSFVQPLLSLVEVITPFFVHRCTLIMLPLQQPQYFPPLTWMSMSPAFRLLWILWMLGLSYSLILSIVSSTILGIEKVYCKYCWMNEKICLHMKCAAWPEHPMHYIVSCN